MPEENRTDERREIPFGPDLPRQRADAIKVFDDKAGEARLACARRLWQA
jgi:hypothetical protein